MGSFGSDMARRAMQTVRRSRRKAELLLVDVKAKVAPDKQEPMSAWGSFLFLSNLITGPGMLGLPVAYVYSGSIPTTVLTCCFAVTSVLACDFLANAVRVYRSEVRAPSPRARRCCVRTPSVPSCPLGAQHMASKMAPGAMTDSLDHKPHLEMENLVRGVCNDVVWAIFQVIFLSSCILMAVSCIVVTAQGQRPTSRLPAPAPHTAPLPRPRPRPRARPHARTSTLPAPPLDPQPARF